MRVLSYAELLGYLRRGFRSGNWRRLDHDDRVMYSAGLEFARVNGKIRNPAIVARLLGIVEKLRASIKTRILRAGQDKARKMLNQYQERGVFSWVPQLRDWLRSLGYKFWLGILRITLEGFYPTYILLLAQNG